MTAGQDSKKQQDGDKELKTNKDSLDHHRDKSAKLIQVRQS